MPLIVEYLSTHHCWSVSKSFIRSIVVWFMTRSNAFGGEKQNKKSNGEQSDLCDLEQVTLKPRLQVHHYLTTWLQIWYRSLLRRGSIRKGADIEKQNCSFGVHSAELIFFLSTSVIFRSLVSDINMREKEGFTPLLLSVSQGHFEVSKLLIDSGADIKETDFDQKNLIHWGVESLSQRKLNQVIN